MLTFELIEILLSFFHSLSLFWLLLQFHFLFRHHHHHRRHRHYLLMFVAVKRKRANFLRALSSDVQLVSLLLLKDEKNEAKWTENQWNSFFRNSTVILSGERSLNQPASALQMTTAVLSKSEIFNGY